MNPKGRPGQPLPDGNTQERYKGYSKLRHTILFCAFLVVLVNPFINYYLQNNFLQGWYQSIGIGSLWFVSPLEGLESLLITKSVYLPSIIGMIIPFTIALLLGRVFCSWICPVTFFLELTDRLRKRISKKKTLRNSLVVAKWILWFTLVAELIISMVLGKPIFVFLSPPGLIGREIMMLVFFGSIAIEGILLLVILLLELVTRRFFCRTFCPLGGLLALIGRKRKLVVEFLPENCTSCRKCERNCPMGLVPQQDEGRSPYCWNCGECIDSCEENSLKLSWHKSQ